MILAALRFDALDYEEKVCLAVFRWVFLFLQLWEVENLSFHTQVCVPLQKRGGIKQYDITCRKRFVRVFNKMLSF